MRFTRWLDCLMDISEDDDLSEELDLGENCDGLIIIFPTITNAQITIRVADKASGTFQDLYVTDPADGSNNKVISAAGTGGITWVVPLGGFQHIKLFSSVAQGDDRTFKVRGIIG